MILDCTFTTFRDIPKKHSSELHKSPCSVDATKRQVSEAVRVQHAQGAVNNNRQDEWRQVKLPRM